MRLDLDAFESGREAAADQFHEEVQLNLPIVAWARTGNAENPCRTALDDVADHQKRSDPEVGPHRRILGLIGPRMGRIPKLRYAQWREPRAQPGQHVEALAAQLLGITRRQQTARH